MPEEDDAPGWIDKVNAIIRVHFGIKNPDELSDEEWAKYYQDYMWVKEYERKQIKNIIKSAIAEAFSKT